MDIELVMEEEELWKCRTHSSQPRSGICPSCLRDRLLLLCPDCANLRPCPCFPSSSSSSSSSSSFSSRFLFDPPRSSYVGSVGRVSSLIEIEPSFGRSRSTTSAASFSFLRPQHQKPRLMEGLKSSPEKGGRFGSFWGMLKLGKVDAAPERSEIHRAEKLARSRSAGVRIGAAGKEKKWSFPSPMRVFRLKKTARVVHERSPMRRG